MLISHSHNFIFVHIAKTAGSSIRKALEPFADSQPNDRLSKLASKLGLARDTHRLYLPKHAGCCYAQRRIGSDHFSHMYKFAFVRNPWDLLVSSYHYIKGNTHHHRNRKVSQLPSFEAFVDYEIHRGKLHQHTAICDKHGTRLVDFVGRFEHLETDFTAICYEIGIYSKLPHVNATQRKPYQSYYSKTLREKVAKVWATDIELFGYRFD